MTDSNTDLFKTIDTERRGTTAEGVISQLREMIHRGELHPGDRLPPERDLARMLGVSRPTLRAGIHSLAAVGILQSRQGAGTFVVKADGPPSLDGSPLRLMASLHGFTSAEMFEARLALEMAIAGLAADRATSDHTATMAEEITGMYASLDEPEQFLIHDMNFHQTIAAASGNRILTALMNMIATILLDVRRKTVHRSRDLKESAGMHRQIYRAIRERNPESARNAMRDHLLLAQKAQEEEEQEAEANAVEDAGGNNGQDTDRAREQA
ncbi:MAG TPA: FadR/GntR family transcriptional regulator [Pyrinomonadaceae bacterium]|jgi:GntR family transcriptional repressor for pyruvate dehydrogenase complex